jgi:hypothetical protein
MLLFILSFGVTMQFHTETSQPSEFSALSNGTRKQAKNWNKNHDRYFSVLHLQI